MEQPPKPMPEIQLPLSFDAPAEAMKPESATEVDPITLTHEALIPILGEISGQTLMACYKKWIDKDPMGRGFSEDELRTGIKNPATEIKRLGEIDADTDRVLRKKGWQHF